MTISNDSKIVAKVALEVFGGHPKVFRYWDEKCESSIDMLTSIDVPVKGVTSYSTLGLFQYEIGYKVENQPLRIEIVGACSTRFECFANIIGTCAFNIINSNFECHHGAIFTNIIELYISNSPMKHILFITPYLWDRNFETVSFIDKTVTWLMAFPISDEELIFAQEKGVDALEDLFEKHQINIYNLNRRSVL